ncbi:MAG: enolase C-terminal domain-like protein [Elusimicrobiota bacterium]|jgi:L-alanine-DL-glutamate epimerase-like enolase superfamily enzyme
MSARCSARAEVAALSAVPLDARLTTDFAIAGGSHDTARNVLVRVRLRGGSVGFGECAPLPAYNGETQAQALAAVRSARWLLGRSAHAWAARAAEIAERVPCLSARAGLEMALLDAWTRSRAVPLRLLFGGAQVRLRTDVTVPILPAEEAARMAAAVRRFGVDALKVKVGRDAGEDAERVLACVRAARPKTLLLDGNAGYRPAEALRLLRLLARAGVRADLFEQPVRKDDLDGLAEVFRSGRVPVAADESCCGPGDVLRLARRKAAQVVNIKLMKGGVLRALETARAARAAGLGLMIGGNVESRLAMTCSAHLAAGFGGFRFVDLDTPLLFKKDPMRGVRIQRGGVYDLSRVKAGIGVVPR